MKSRSITTILIAMLFAVATPAQNTSFTYQGSLTQNGTAANGSFDFEFALFDSLSGGAQQGSTIALNGVTVENGVFSATLDYGLQFPGAPRFLEIRVRQTGAGGFTTLSPRQPTNSSPYSIRTLTSSSSDSALNSLKLGGVDADLFVTIPNGGANFIRNSVGEQPNSNFSISGNGSAGGTLSGQFVNATFGYRFGGQPFLNAVLTNSFFGLETGSANLGTGNIYAGYRAGNAATSLASNNAFFGVNAGRLNSFGTNNSFFGMNAGEGNASGSFNAFFGNNAGSANSAGHRNTFLGVTAGRDNINGSDNTFVGSVAGQRNISGGDNSFFGTTAGVLNESGSFNSFFGRNSGSASTTGSYNSFFGAQAGVTNVSGSENTMLGFAANANPGNLTSATAIGAWSYVTTSYSLVLGAIAGVNGATVDTNVGIGTTSPAFRLDVGDRIRLKQKSDGTGAVNTAGLWLFQNAPNANQAFIGMENDNSVGLYGNNGGGWGLVMSTQTGVTAVRQLGAAGSTQLCRNAQNEISSCSSSLRYKTNINPFSTGLQFINQLRPISFDWIDGGMKDIGFGAEDIARINPLFVNFNDKGEVEGVKYDRLSVVFVNAFKEQQIQIEQQKALIEKQQSEIEMMQKFLCSRFGAAEFCKSN